MKKIAGKDELVEQCRKSGKLPGFAIGSMPVLLFEAFMHDVEERYNNVYWAKLQDLMRKAEAYDALVAIGGVPPQEESVEDEKEDGSEVLTFRGPQKNR